MSGKHASYLQSADGHRSAVDFAFFSELFLPPDGDAREATLRLPTGDIMASIDKRRTTGGGRDDILLTAGAGRFPTYADLQDRHPDGKYQVSFTTPSGSADHEPLLFATRGLPAPPRIYLSQSDSGIDDSVAGGDYAVSVEHASWRARKKSQESLQ